MLPEPSGRCPFVVVPGRGAASGAREYQEIKGSIHAQKKHFDRAGLSLDSFYAGTLNLDVAPARLRVKRPLIRLKDIRWLDGFPGEDFDFMNAAIGLAGNIVPCLIYYPRPETKEAFTAKASESLVEVLAPYVEGVTYGAKGLLYFDPAQMEIE